MAPEGLYDLDLGIYEGVDPAMGPYTDGGL